MNNNEWKSVTQLFKTKISGELGGSPLVQNEIINSTAEILTEDNLINIYVKNPVLVGKMGDYKPLVEECIREVFQQSFDIKFNVGKIQSKTETGDLPMFHSFPSEQSTTNQNLDSLIKKANLRKEFTMESFIRSGSNDLAYAAARSVSDTPGTQFNPFFVYGNSGLGKTHLINAIGIEILKKFPNYKILYTPFETFFNDFLETFNSPTKRATINKQDFRTKYRAIDVLIIDDIQGISGREGTENEFFNIFNELYRENKQIILTSDVHPNEFKQLPDRIKSRFNQGLVIDIRNPDYELRFNLIKRKAVEDRIMLENDAIDFIVSNVNRNMRELEGAYARVKIFLQTSREVGNRENVLKALRDLSGFIKVEENLSPSKIIDLVCTHFKIKKEELKKQDRSKRVAYPRQICMYLLRKHTDLNYTDIAHLLGRKDHTTIIHGVEKIEQDLTEGVNDINSHISILKDSIFKR
jgi:chromosomal replication initiator protein